MEVSKMMEEAFGSSFPYSLFNPSFQSGICQCFPGEFAHVGSSDILDHSKSATIPWGYVARTSKTYFYYKQKGVSNLKLHFTVGGK